MAQVEFHVSKACATLALARRVVTFSSIRRFRCVSCTFSNHAENAEASAALVTVRTHHTGQKWRGRCAEVSQTYVSLDSG